MKEIKIPEGTKSMTYNIEKNKMVIEFIPKKLEEEYEPKDGDIISFRNSIGICGGIYQSDEGSFYQFRNYFQLDNDNNEINTDTFYSMKEAPQLATKGETKKLFDAMAKEGLKWNAKQKKIEKIRWRACVIGDYFYIDSDMEIMTDVDQRYPLDDNRFKNWNYFKTEEEAERKAEQIKKVLKGE